jgi:4-amino-4-deoxy-L-arabinose transferase-like glycosyltransferase
VIRLLTGLVFLVGVGLRLHALAQDVRFHPDEAWFSTFARAAALNGDWWLPGPLDKPPLALYANALSQALIGDHEFAARLPGALASILLMPALAAAAQAWYRPPAHRSGLRLLGLGLTALSPYALAFSATAFTDGLMLLCLVLALWRAGANRWGQSGLWLGLAFASKPQALYYLPLLLLLGWSVGSLSYQRLLRLTGGTLAVSTLLLLWDTVRPGDSVFALAAAHNDPGRLIRSSEILPRLRIWSAYAGALFGPPWLTAGLGLTGLAGVLRGLVRQPRQHGAFVDLTLIIFVLAYSLIHWLVAFNTYDRYLLPLLPPVILLISRGLDRLIAARCALILAVVVLLIVPAAQAAAGRSAINAEHPSYAGIDQLAAFLNAQPVATVIYDHWLGWQLGYYLGQWHNKRLVYYPSPDALARDALRLCEIGPRYLPAPAEQAAAPWLERLDAAGFQIEPIGVNAHFVAYRLLPPWSSTAECPAAPP